MKKATLLLLVLVLVTFATEGMAKNRRRSLMSGDSSPFWLGLASATNTVKGANPALSFMIPLSEMGGLQGYFNIASSSPFNFGLGAHYKHSVLGDLRKGMHLGAGLGMGTFASGVSTTDFYLNINFLGGFHFHIIDRILISADGGLTIATGGGTQVSLGALSALWGISILYRL